MVRVDTIIDCTRFSSLNKLLRVTAYVQRFVNALRRQDQRGETGQDSPFITAANVKVAEELWIWLVQSESFGVEVPYFQTDGKHVAPLQVSQFRLFMDILEVSISQSNNRLLTTWAEVIPYLTKLQNV